MEHRGHDLILCVRVCAHKGSWEGNYTKKQPMTAFTVLISKAERSTECDRAENVNTHSCRYACSHTLFHHLMCMQLCVQARRSSLSSVFISQPAVRQCDQLCAVSSCSLRAIIISNIKPSFSAWLAAEITL